MRVLGIETSCDETAIAVVEDGRKLLSNIVSSQVDLHARYGGVVPEVASRKHLEMMMPVLETALGEAGSVIEDIDAIAVTYGPGLAGSLLVGVNAAKALAYAWEKPLIPVNHLEGHIYANWIGVETLPQLPALGLIVSGGHTDVVLMRQHGDYERLGQTVDDAAGEAFDKVARLLGLGFPGGPAVEKMARTAKHTGPQLPRAKLDGPYDFSFSGLKTKVQRIVRGEEGEVPPREELAAAFQEAVVDAVVTKAVKAAEANGVAEVLLSGGVAANLLLREALAARCPLPVRVPPISLCTDNGAMIAACAYYRAQEVGEFDPLALDVDPGLRIG
ncbi:MAG TPA: tRNA (adenosine(37)-N6)-threonylcarbamoyltransferase complex transferase subunit TsaD [Dehalococcoidia bacterium]|nr:tRNA (adenosine(37)-N6)-threonylcarbamoyltransferase complex transferase subunit TsaD [Dehalococcoidia bacterium]